jgi:hypothetical protein
VAEDLHEIRITVDTETLKTLEELQASMAASLKNPGSRSELFARLIRMAHERKSAKAASKPSKTEATRMDRRDASPAPGFAPRKAIPASIEREVRERAGHRCEEHLPDGSRCDSRYRLETEHRVPRALGGTDELHNLQLLCRAHNQIRGIRRFGPDRMRRA